MPAAQLVEGIAARQAKKRAQARGGRDPAAA